MTLQTDDDTRTYANPAGTSFNGPPAFVASTLFLYVVESDGVTRTLIPSSDYTVSQLGRNLGTRIVLDAPIASPAGKTLLIQRTVPYNQLTDITNQGDFNAQVLEGGLDSLGMQTQQLARQGSKALRFPDNVLVDFDPVIPTPLNPLDIVQVRPDGLGFVLSPPPAIATLADGAVTDDKVAPGAAIQGDKLEFVQDSVDAVAQGIQSKLRKMEINAADLGLVANGVADDSAILEKLIALAGQSGRRLILPEGTAASPRIIRITRPLVIGAGLSAANWLGGGRDKTIIRLNAATLATDAIALLGAPKFIRIAGIRFDQNNATTATAVGMLGIQNGEDISIEDCEFLNFDKMGLAFNGCRGWKVNRNKFTRSASGGAATAYNQAFLVSDSAQSVRDGEFAFNVCVGSATDFAGQNLDIHHNDVSAWGFGAGVTIEQTVNTHSNSIRSNKLHNSLAVIDVNGYRPGGIENWGADTAILDNELYSNAGAGMDQGGQRCGVARNTCYNNGQHAPSQGIVSRYGNATYNASGSTYIGNRCFDTQGVKTQTTSYADQSASLSNLTFRGNQFNSGAGVTPESIISAAPDYQGPSLQSAAAAYNPPSVASGASITANITVPGALGGDFVDVSFDQDNQGCQFTGYVSATNQVTIVLSNLTGGAKDLASGFARARVTKPMNYAAY